MSLWFAGIIEGKRILKEREEKSLKILLFAFLMMFLFFFIFGIIVIINGKNFSWFSVGCLFLSLIFLLGIRKTIFMLRKFKNQILVVKQ